MDSPLISSHRPKPEPQTGHLAVGYLIFPRMNQIDFTGPFQCSRESRTQSVKMTA
jgi:hypothetical protein